MPPIFVSFLIIAGLLVVAAIALLAIPLWRTPAKQRDDDADSVDALNVLRDQKRELDAEVAAGRMSEAEREAQITELSRRVIDEGLAPPEQIATPDHGAPDQSATSKQGTRKHAPLRRPRLALVVALLVPAIALPIYWLVGTPAAIDPSARAPAAAQDRAPISPEQFRAALADLRAKQDANPSDATGWRMLGRGLRIVGDLQASVDAFAKASALQPDDAGTLVDHAESLALMNNRDLSGKPSELVQRALKLNPQLPKALAMAGAAELAAGRADSAKQYWQRLLAVIPPDSREAGELQQMIAQIETGASAPAVALTGTVRIAPALVAQMRADDTLFIFARAASGPRMPLAILKRKAGELPLQFRLDNSNAMAGGPTLSSASQVRVEARISRAGQAAPQPGDLRGESAIVAPGTSKLDVVIDQVVR